MAIILYSQIQFPNKNIASKLRIILPASQPYKKLQNYNSNNNLLIWWSYNL